MDGLITSVVSPWKTLLPFTLWALLCSLTYGINGVELILARQTKHLPQIDQNKTNFAGYHGIRRFTHVVSIMLIHHIRVSRINKVKPSLRIMPPAGSVTCGSGSSDGNSYRRALRQILTSDCYFVEMVRSRKSGSMENNDNEGWRGLRIEQVANKAKRSVPRLLLNLFTVNVGSNYYIQDFEIGTAGKRVSDMLEYLWASSSGSMVVLSTLLPNLGGNHESYASMSSSGE